MPVTLSSLHSHTGSRPGHQTAPQGWTWLGLPYSVHSSIFHCNYSVPPCNVELEIRLSICLSVHVSHRCLEDIFRTTKLCATKLGMMVHHRNPECHVKGPGSYLQGQGHSAGSKPKKNPQLFLLHLVNLLTFCNQIWCKGASLHARVLYDNFRLLSSRSRSQWGSKSSGNICPDVFSIT